MRAGSVRKYTPAASISAELNPSRRRRIVITAGQDDPSARPAQPDQRVLAQQHGIQRGTARS